MKIGVMQPYFFQYLGYWQLIKAVDKYVIFDDVNYIKRGWVNRNRIINGGTIQYFNVYLKAVSQNKLINEIEVNQEGLNNKNTKIIESAYKKAPFFKDAYPVIEKILSQSEKNLAKYNGFLIKTVCDYLDIKTELLYSSKIDKNPNLRGQDKIITICKVLGATDYINAIGGQELYDSDSFKENGIKLKFLKMNNIQYKQFSEKFYDNLSIIDVMMFNPKKTVIDYLNRYTLIEGGKHVYLEKIQ